MSKEQQGLHGLTVCLLEWYLPFDMHGLSNMSLKAHHLNVHCDDPKRLHYPQVPPQAGPDVREGYLQRVAGFFDQLLGRVARAFSPKTEQTGDPLPTPGSTLVLSPSC